MQCFRKCCTISPVASSFMKVMHLQSRGSSEDCLVVVIIGKYNVDLYRFILPLHMFGQFVVIDVGQRPASYGNGDIMEAC